MTATLPQAASTAAAALAAAAALGLVLSEPAGAAVRLRRLGGGRGPAARAGGRADPGRPRVGGHGRGLLAAAAAAVLVAAATGPVPGGLAALAVLLGHRALVRARLRRTAEARGSAVVEAGAVLADELRAGAAPLDALRTAAALGGPLADDLGRLVRAAEYGGDIPAGLRTVARLEGAEGLRAVAACWAACTASGAGLAEVMHGVARTLRERERLRSEARAHLASARTSAWLLAGLPVVGLLLGQGIGARPLGVLLGTALGHVALVIAVGLELAGLSWMAALLRRAEPP